MAEFKGKAISEQKNSSLNTSESEKELALTALAEFNKKNYNEAVVILKKLQSSRSKDIKVLANKAVVEYYISGLKNTDVFLKELSKICEKCGISLDEIKSSDEIEASVLRLNQCTVLFHQKQLNSSRVLLESMYKGLESVEESVSIGLCLLLSEVLLGLSLPGRALAVVAHTEATFLPQPLPPQTSSTKQLHSEKDSSSPEKSPNSSGMSSPGFNRSNIMNSQASDDPIGGSSELRCSADQEVLRGRLLLLRLRCLLEMKISRIGKELKSFSAHVAGSGNSLNVTLIMLKAQLEYIKGAYKKAIQILAQCSTIAEPSPLYVPGMSLSYYNNLGVSHMCLNLPASAIVYFGKAMQELKKGYAEEGEGDDFSLPLYRSGSDVTLKLFYNLGVTLLQMRKAENAFELLLEVATSYPSNPRLWMRLAECCIEAHKKKLNKNSSNQFHHETIDSLSESKIRIWSNNVAYEANTIDDLSSPVSPLSPRLSLCFASICLRNCLSLVPENASAKLPTDEQEASGVMPELIACPPCSPLKGSEALYLRLRCLTASAYVCLCLRDAITALKHSETVLQTLPSLTNGEDTLKLLCHLYAGEALVMLDRTTEALDHFDPSVVGELNIRTEPLLPYSYNEDNYVWHPLSTPVANKLLVYNLSAAYAIKGELKKANQVISQILEEDSNCMPAQVAMLSLYIKLQLGLTDTIAPIIEESLQKCYI